MIIIIIDYLSTREKTVSIYFKVDMSKYLSIVDLERSMSNVAMSKVVQNKIDSYTLYPEVYLGKGYGSRAANY